MKIKKIAVSATVVCVFLLSGCNFNGVFVPETRNGREVSVPVTVMDALSTGPAPEDSTTLTMYDFSRLQYSANSVAVACYDLREGRYLYEKNTQSRISPASLAKIVTACVALKYMDPAAVCTVGDEIDLIGENSSTCEIRSGQRMTLYDLLCGMLLVSGNDAAYTVAVNVARAVSGSPMTTYEALNYFVGLMNGFCVEAGLTDSRFANPDGWDDPNEYMSLRDIITAAKLAMQLDVFREIVCMTGYHTTVVSGETVSWTNINQMMNVDSPFYLEGIYGIKTGTTGNAGKCIIACYQDSERTLLIASMGNSDEAERCYSVREIVDAVKSQ